MIKNKTSLLPLGAAGAAIVSLGWATPTHALTVLNNPLYDNGANPFVATSGISATQQKAISFTTDNRDWSVDSVTLTFTGFDNLDTQRIEIRADNAGDPDSVALASFINPNPAPDNLGAVTDFTFAPSSPFTFNANTTYWLVVAQSGTRDFNWAVLTNRPLPTSIEGWTTAGYKQSVDSGASWTSSSLFNPVQIDATPIPFAFTPIPGLIVSGIVGGLRRARKKAINPVEA